MRTSRSTFRPARLVRTDGYTLHTKPGKIIAFQPHMHIRGKYQCLELIYPSNPSKVMKREMINCAHWDYNWHLVYNYADDVAPLVPAGTIVHIISWHDNSAQQSPQPRPEELGRLRSAHHRRDGVRVDRLDRSDAGGVRAGAGRAQGSPSRPGDRSAALTCCRNSER